MDEFRKDVRKGDSEEKLKRRIWGCRQLSGDTDVCIKVYDYLLTRIILQIALKQTFYTLLLFSQ